MMKAWKRLALILGAAVLFAFGAAAETDGGYEYEVKEDGTAVITGYTGEDAELTIPAELGGHTVTEIGTRAFSWTPVSITAVKIPDSVVRIGDGAFNGCYMLADIGAIDPAVEISDSAFSGCRELIDDSGFFILNGTLFCWKGSWEETDTDVVIPDGVTRIGANAFSFSRLKSVVIPDSVTSIGMGAFQECYDLVSAVIPESVTRIGGYAFAKCSSLKDIGTLRADVELSDYYTFSGCWGLTDQDGFLILNGVLFQWPFDGAEVITVPDTVTRIGADVFSGRDRLRVVNLPDGLTGIGYGAFSSCSSLTALTIPAGVTAIGEDAFDYISDSITLTVEPGSYAEQYCRDNALRYTYPGSN